MRGLLAWMLANMTHAVTNADENKKGLIYSAPFGFNG